MRSWIMMVTMATVTAKAAIPARMAQTRRIRSSIMARISYDFDGKLGRRQHRDRGGVVEEVQLASNIERPRRLVTLQRDGAEFVVSFYPEDIVVFRHTEPNARSEDVHLPSVADHRRQLGLGRYGHEQLDHVEWLRCHSVVSAALVSSGLRFSARCLVVLVEHKQPHGRGKVARRTLRIDVGDQLGPGYAATCGDIV